MMFARFDRVGRSALIALALLALAAWVREAAAATPSELLEKAIYTEETVGNLDEAIKLYEQVIAEGRAAKSAAAQAQYRLGLAYLKKDKRAEATAAFQALIKDFPGEKDLIAKAQQHLPSKLELLPAPWNDGEVLQLDMKLATGLDIGTMIYMVSADKHEGRDVWRCSTRGVVTVNGSTGFSEVLCEKESFAPIKSHWKHSLIGEASAIYQPTSVEIKTVGKPEPRTIEFAPPVFDNEQAGELFRRLPLEVGYKTNIPIITTLGSGRIDLALEVQSKETLEVPAGKFECYKLDLGIIGQTFWISTDKNRYLVRFGAGGLTADLTKIEHRKPGQTTPFKGANFSVTLPAGWHAYSPVDPSKKDQTDAVLLDPRAIARAEVVVKPKDTLSDEQRKSPKAWTETAIEKFKTRLSDFRVREQGVEETKLGDAAAATMVADFTDDGKKHTMYGVAVFAANSAANLRLTVEADKFHEARKDFDAIVKSLELK